MNILTSLLQAIVQVDGDSLVVPGAGKAYVMVQGAGLDLCGLDVTLSGANDVARELLPVHLQLALEDIGSVRCELPAMAAFPSDRFTVVASHGPDGVRTEIHRIRVPDDFRLPGDLFTSTASSTESAFWREPVSVTTQFADYAEADYVASDIFATPGARDASEFSPLVETARAGNECLLVPDADYLWPDAVAAVA